MDENQLEEKCLHKIPVHYYLMGILPKTSAYTRHYRYTASKNGHKVAIDLFTNDNHARSREDFEYLLHTKLQKEMVPYLLDGYELSDRVDYWSNEDLGEQLEVLDSGKYMGDGILELHIEVFEG